jgi:hypothetical protein
LSPHEHGDKLHEALVEALKSNAKVLADLKQRDLLHAQAISRMVQDHQYKVTVLAQQHKADIASWHTEVLNLQEDVAEEKSRAEEHVVALKAREKDVAMESRTDEAVNSTEKSKLLTDKAEWHTRALNLEEDVVHYRAGIVKMTARRVVNVLLHHTREVVSKAFGSWNDAVHATFVNSLIGSSITQHMKLK